MMIRLLQRLVCRGRKIVLAGMLVLPAACATVPSGAPDTRVKPGEPCRANAMVVPHDMGRPFSLYGIELGEPRLDVESDYQLIGCRREYHGARCTVKLDTKDVTGVSAMDTTILFILFHNDEQESVRSVSMIVFPQHYQQVLQNLQRIYQGPGIVEGRITSWTNESGTIELDTHTHNNSPSGLRYIAR